MKLVDKSDISYKGGSKQYTDEKLLNELRRFEKKEGRSPTEKDFENNYEYPHYKTYVRRFGSWINALKLTELDIDLMGPRGSNYKGRVGEIKVINHFKQHPIDLAGENYHSPYDGICPNGKTYDVKSSKSGYEKKCYTFGTNNKCKEEIEIYYLLAFNEDYTKLDYGWRIPGEIVESSTFHIGFGSSYKFNVENMKEYEITDKFKDILKEE